MAFSPPPAGGGETVKLTAVVPELDSRDGGTGRRSMIMAGQYTIEELRRRIAPIAQQYGVQSVSLFGSYSKGTADAGSDIDLKIEKGKLKSLFQICGFRLAVEDALERSVDLVTSESSDQTFLDMIEKDEVLLYRTPR